ncbi:MAG: (4Fe-4S)-binding protein [Thermodesulfobacteriota bacterium]
MRLKIDFNQCCGCRRCEVACSLHHYENTVNPKKSRIRIFSEEAAFYPVVAGPPNNDECTAKNTVVIGDKEVDECIICRASCPIKPLFKETDKEVLLQCDFCGDPPEPACAKWCPCQAITLVDEEGKIEVKIEDIKKDYQREKGKKAPPHNGTDGPPLRYSPDKIVF